MSLPSDNLTETSVAHGDTTPARSASTHCALAPASRDLLDHLPVGIVRLSEQLATIACNRSARELFDATDDWLSAWERRATPITASPSWRDAFTQVLAHGATRVFESVRYVAGDDRPLTLNVTVRRQEHDGQPGLLVVIEDVTRAADLTQRLAATEDMAAVGRLAARVAHELNNPLDGALRYVNLCTRVLEKSAAGQAASAVEKIPEYLAQVRAGLLRMTQIVRDLLEFSRNTPTLRESGNINRVVEEALQSLSDHADANRIAIMADFHDDRNMPTLEGTKLFQVCCNLIKNALDAMPDGGRLTIRTGIVEQQVVIQFADTGPGLPDDPECIFAPFYTTKSVGQGTGLGLAICREYLAQLGGAISAENGKQDGAVFTVRIPIASCPAQRAPLPTQEAS